MAPKKDNAAEYRLQTIRSVSRKVCAICDEKDDCQESRHRRKLVQRWMCLTCCKDHISKAGAIQHIQEEHECNPRTCACGEKLFTISEYDRHRSTVHDPPTYQKSQPSGERGSKRRQTDEDQDPDSKRPRMRAEAAFDDLYAKVVSQMRSKD